MAEITDKTKTRIRKAQNPGHDQIAENNQAQFEAFFNVGGATKVRAWN
jgi:hypothetical protein